MSIWTLIATMEEFYLFAFFIFIDIACYDGKKQKKKIYIYTLLIKNINREERFDWPEAREKSILYNLVPNLLDYDIKL